MSREDAAAAPGAGEATATASPDTSQPFERSSQVAALLAAFRSTALPHASWNHRAHLAVALVLARELDRPAVLETMRAGIQRYNAAHGVISTPTGGYHETLTRFYMHLVDCYINEVPAADLAEDANRLYLQWGRRDLALEYYTRERLFSEAARADWVEPNLRSLPVPRRPS